MAEFLFDLTFMVEVIAVAGGLITLHFARKEKSNLLRLAAWILIVIGVGSAGCSMIYAFKYRGQGAFSIAYPAIPSITRPAPYPTPHQMSDQSE